jgi:hypothetical protein
LPGLLIKAAYGEAPGGQYQHGWYLPNEFLNSPWRGGGSGMPMPGAHAHYQFVAVIVSVVN